MKWLLSSSLVFILTVSTPGFSDQREIVSVKEYPWSTVGRVGFGHGWCSAVLIGPALAATAAHCLWNKATGRQMTAQALTLVVGWDRGQFIDGTAVVRVTLPPNWVPQEMEHYGQEQAGRDWALLELEKPLGRTAGWVALSDDIKQNSVVAAVGYGEDRKHVATAHQGCHILDHLPSGAWTHNCDAVHGDSGGPVFSWDGTMLRVVAINVARFNGSLGGAVAAADFSAVARKLGAPAENNNGELTGTR
jgi:protease YdgD